MAYNKQRPERYTLKEKRDMQYENFRRNLRVLRSSSDESGVTFARKTSIKNGARVLNLEYGRANPTVDEVLAISQFFEVTMDDLLNKKVKISFENEQPIPTQN